jgi:hypothetical protein
MNKGPNIALTRSLGISPEKEFEQFMRTHGLTRRLEALGAVDLQGRFTAELSEIDRVKLATANLSAISVRPAGWRASR